MVYGCVSSVFSGTRGWIPDLMNMVVHVFASNDWCNGVALLGACFGASTLELQTLFFKTSLDGVGVTMLNLTLLNGGHSVRVLFRENFTILDRLDRSVVMVLVHLAINGSLSLFMTLLDDLLVHDGGSNLFVHCGVMVTGFVP